MGGGCSKDTTRSDVVADFSHVYEEPISDTSCPMPNDHPRVMERIANPKNKDFPPQHSLEVLTHCIQQGVIQAERAKGKDLLLFLGNTGAGKSTFANYLSGCTMVGVDPDTLGKVADSDLVMVKPPEKGGNRRPLMTIGHSTTSQTFLPHIATPGRSSGLDLTFCDCPGFLDSRGPEINIANAVNIRATVAAAKSIRLLILLNYSSISNDRGAGVKQLLELCADIFGSVDELVKRRESLLIGISRCQKYDTMDVSKMRRFIIEGAENKASAEKLAERLFAFDPLEFQGKIRIRDKPAFPLPADWWTRDTLVKQIPALTPIPSSAKTFTTVLTVEDKDMLHTLSQRVAESITKSMEARRYTEAAAALTNLQQLALIDNPLITELLQQQEAHLRRLVKDLVSDFEHACDTEDFAQAQLLHGELLTAVKPFTKLLSDLVNDEQLTSYYDTAHAKFKEAENEHRALEEKLADVEERRAETQRRLEEQQVANEDLIQQLQKQVHSTQAEKDAAIEKRAELEKQIAETRQVLDKAKADQEELLRLQAAEAQRKVTEKTKAVAALSNRQPSILTRAVSIAHRRGSGSAAQVPQTKGQAAPLPVQIPRNANRVKNSGDSDTSSSSLVLNPSQVSNSVHSALPGASGFSSSASTTAGYPGVQTFVAVPSTNMIASSSLKAFSLPESPLPTAAQLAERKEQARTGKLRYHCFLSHRRTDCADLARSLKESLLKDHSIKSFLDEDSEGDIGDSLLDEVSSSYCLVLLLSTNLFSSMWCAREVRQAIRWGVPVVLVQVADVKWNIDGQTYEFPPPVLLNTWPDEVRPAFEGPKAIQHVRSFWSEFKERLARRIERHTNDAMGIAVNESEKLKPLSFSVNETSATSKLPSDTTPLSTTTAGSKVPSNATPSSTTTTGSKVPLDTTTSSTPATAESKLSARIGSTPDAEAKKPPVVAGEVNVDPTPAAALSVIEKRELKRAREMNEAGESLLRRGQLEEPLEFFEESLTIRLKLVPNSLMVATVYDNIGLVYTHQGKLSEALQFLQKALTLREKLAPSSLDVALSYNNLGVVRHIEAKYADALEYHQKSLDIRKQIAPDSLLVAGSLNNIGLAVQFQENPAAALELFESSRAICERIAPEDLEAAKMYQCIGDVYFVQSKYAEALEMVQKSLAIYERIAPNTYLPTRSYLIAGNVNLAMENYKDALKYFKKCLGIRQRVAPDSSGVAYCYYSIGRVYYSQRKYVEALENHHKARVIREQLIPGSLDLSYSFEQIATIYMDQAKYESALEYYKKCLSIRQEISPDGSMVAFCYFHIGQVYYHQKKYVGAWEYHHKALAIRERLGESTMTDSRDMIEKLPKPRSG